MTSYKMSRMRRTRTGYEFASDLDLETGAEAENKLFALISDFRTRVLGAKPVAAAFSMSEWKAGAMSGDTWLRADGLLLEYLAGNEDEMTARAKEIAHAADSLGYGFLLLDTCTRQGERTFTVCWRFTDPVDAKQYTRIASVMAERMGVYRATDGIVAHTHLSHWHPMSSAIVVDGPAINPKMLIHETARLFKDMDHSRFERAKPKTKAADVQVTPPVSTTNDNLFDDLFSF